MARTCNIGTKGRSVRLFLGAGVLLVAGVVIALAVADIWPHWSAWLVAALCIAGGTFCIYEAKAGWCALRAMGIHTPV